LVSDPEDTERIAVLLDSMLEDYVERGRVGLNAQRRVYDEFLIFTQMRRWLQMLADQAGP
jgi:trehalose synthase